MRDRFLPISTVLGLAAMLAGCGAGSGLSTGSLSGAGGPAAPKAVTPSERALYVGATVARAQRCGFYFDPDQVRSNYLAAESQAGTPPDVMQKVTREFDYTRQSIVAAVAKDDGYCTEGRNREVKAALTRQLAGDFNPPQKRQEISVGLFEHQKRDQPFDGEKVFDTTKRTPNPMGGGD